MKLTDALDKFRVWAADGHEGSYGEWECDYEHWDDIYSALDAAIEIFPPPASPEDILFALARDNEIEDIRRRLVARPHVLLWLASAAFACSERDARWQVAVGLGEIGSSDALDLLRHFLSDSDEYVRRRALGAYAAHRPSEAEPIAWDWLSSSEPYSRLAALHALRDIRSLRFPAALRMLRDDPFDIIRERVVEFTSHIRGSNPQTA
jgi:HEAT repeat protein